MKKSSKLLCLVLSMMLLTACGEEERAFTKTADHKTATDEFQTFTDGTEVAYFEDPNEGYRILDQDNLFDAETGYSVADISSAVKSTFGSYDESKEDTVEYTKIDCGDDGVQELKVELGYPGAPFDDYTVTFIVRRTEEGYKVCYYTTSTLRDAENVNIHGEVTPAGAAYLGVAGGDYGILGADGKYSFRYHMDYYLSMEDYARDLKASRGIEFDVNSADWGETQVEEYYFDQDSENRTYYTVYYPDDSSDANDEFCKAAFEAVGIKTYTEDEISELMDGTSISEESVSESNDEYTPDKISFEITENEFIEAVGEQTEIGESFASVEFDLDNDGVSEAIVITGYEDEPEYREENDDAIYFRVSKMWFIDEKKNVTEMSDFDEYSLIRGELELNKTEERNYIAMNGYSGVDGIGMVYTSMNDQLENAVQGAWLKGQKHFDSDNDLVWVVEFYGQYLDKSSNELSGKVYLPYHFELSYGFYYIYGAQIVDLNSVNAIADVDLTDLEEASSVSYILRDNNELDINYCMENDDGYDYYANSYVLSDDESKWMLKESLQGNYELYLTSSALMRSMDADYLSSLYSKKKVSEAACDFNGEWKATNTHSSIGGTVTITDQDNEKFSYTGDFWYYYHTGSDEGEAYFINENLAICQHEDAEDAYTVFYMSGDQLYISSLNYDMYMGANVSVNGEYTKGEPVYTNAGILEKTYSEEELAQVKALLTEEEYQDIFVYATEDGDVMVYNGEFTDGTKCKHIECIFPTNGGFGYDIMISESGNMYIMLHNYSEDIFYTNDEAWTTEKLPEINE